MYQRYAHDIPLCPDDTTILSYALVCAFPAVDNPASSATTPDGLRKVAANLIQNAAMAQNLYDTDFAMPNPPKAPSVSLIPGDHQVTITWNSASEFSRDLFYDQYAGTNDYREYDFEGYRVYRSTTGEANDAELLAQFDLKNGIVFDTGVGFRSVPILDDNDIIIGYERTSAVADTLGVSEHDPQGGSLYGLGRDTGLRYSYVDRYEEHLEYGAKATTQHRLTNGFPLFLCDYRL